MGYGAIHKKIHLHLLRSERKLVSTDDMKELFGAPMNIRRYHANHLQNALQIKDVVIYSSASFIKMAANLSKRFIGKKFLAMSKKNYTATVARTQNIAIQKTGNACHGTTSMEAPQTTPEVICPSPAHRSARQCLQSALPIFAKKKKHPLLLTRQTRKEWYREFDGCSIKYELINGNMIHKISKGYLSVEHVMPVYEMQEHLINSCGLADQPYYIINDVTALRGTSLKARKMYSSLLSEWFEKYPGVRRIIVCGANSPMRAGFSISMYTEQFYVVFADDLDGAMSIIQKDKEKKSPDYPGFFKGKAFPRDTVKHYANELNFFLGNIDWEVEGTSTLSEKKGDDHPFKTVYDAIALIKGDIDELFHERKMAQVALRESEEVARALLNATSDMALLIRSDGMIISANQPFATFLDETPTTIKGKRLIDFFPQYVVNLGWSHAKRVVNTGEPAWFETRLTNRYFHNTIYPVFNMEKKVDRLALYLRDITELKQAEKQISGLTQELIKAQEKERRRIARDLHDNVAQDLASLIIQSDSLFAGFGEAPDEVRKRCRHFSHVLKKSIASIRDLAYDLRPPGLEQVGFAKTIGQLCLDFTDKHGIDIDLFTAGLEGLNLDTDTKLNLFRILQEALNNIDKHAEATCITVRLLASHPHLIMKIEDDGCGFDPEVRMMTALQEKRMGIKNMEERVNLLGGELTIQSRKERGTRVVVKYPYHQQASRQ